ncbi:phosphatase PAP2 family protein [Microbacterium hydrocarbonoxydans]|uniref:phosphatase PAP2 family protein n=1 Tax=Microbacterium hydrocarbonoxydans TaxID=273678 RepID=UPI00203F1C11|nr:phosphatase PAP2 family protein [Microbacterium hydrocarbonoxydans]MCM3779979.1 phosphatase PAP2 family protein [Microbacterium hydrocarbonoxydans]
MRSRTLLWWGLGTLVAAALLGAAIVFGYTEPPGFDRWWNEAIAQHRADWMLTGALVLDHIGGGWVAILVVPLLVIIALLLARRWRGAVFAAAAFLASAALVQLLKNLFGRARPEDMIVTSDFGSFPSGHTANAATIALVLYLLFPRVWVAIVGAAWIVAMAVSRTLLSVHWATDTLGGALVGASAVLLIAAVLLPWARTTSKRIPRPIG